MVMGRGAQHSTTPLDCVTPPRIGTTFTLRFQNEALPAESFLLFGPCQDGPATLIGPTLCDTLYLWLLVVGSRSTPASPAEFPIVIPYEPALIGYTTCVQGAYPRALPCWMATDGVRVTVQK